MSRTFLRYAAKMINICNGKHKDLAIHVYIVIIITTAFAIYKGESVYGGDIVRSEYVDAFFLLFFVCLRFLKLF